MSYTWDGCGTCKFWKQIDKMNGLCKEYPKIEKNVLKYCNKSGQLKTWYGSWCPLWEKK